MASREVILREDVPNLGHTGDVVRVRPGYARKFLLPRGPAVEPSHRNLRMLEPEKRVLATRADRQQQAAEGVRTKLDGLALTIRALAGETGRLFGSVTNLDIERLLSERGFSVDRRRIMLRPDQGPRDARRRGADRRQPTKRVPRRKLHHLGDDELAGVHRSLPEKSQKGAKRAIGRSSR